MNNLPLNLYKDDFENIAEAWQGDLWDRKRLGVQLTKYVDRLHCGAVLALDAHWGEGKTWFVRNWKRHLETTEIAHNVIYLDAFANDYLDDPFLVIAAEIAAKLDQTADKDLVNKFKKAAAVMQQGLLTIAPTLIASMVSCALTGGVIPFINVKSESIRDQIDDAVDKVAENIGEKVTEAIQNKIDSYEEEKQSLVAFKETLSELAASLDKPLVFIIDELDRCRPDFAIRLIERIKHFFDIPKIVFVLVIDKDNLSQVITSHYGYSNEGNEKYLDKFIDFVIPLPKVSQADKNVIVHFEVIKKLLLRVGEELNDIHLLFYLGQYGYYFSPRQLKRKINEYALLKTKDSKKNLFLVIAIMRGANNLVDSLTQTLEILSEITSQNNSTFGKKKLMDYEIKVAGNIIETKFQINAPIYMQLIESIINIEINFSKRANSQEHKREAYNALLKSYALKEFTNYYEISQQFQLYLNAHLGLQEGVNDSK